MSMDPNTQNQRWSQWQFDIHESGRHVARANVEHNFARWAFKGFGQAGKVVVRPASFGWRCLLRVEGADANDPAYVQSVRLDFNQKFVEKGWNLMSFGVVYARVLSGEDAQGAPRDQWVEIPMIRLPEGAM